ncbi:M48 family metalloprotease [Gilliamella sp. Pas-s25]|uniref:M48 family metalloprotease n=1 Tax=Gilliamella sp. Pas-s25 TaxID=2687310 RepID=UPI00135D9469|nr:M48 family metalloprotease [Gilliamella sp. Pas-s25]MWP61394.1 M48 family metalloprotease [Gilliamella sp. Pas-s25]
MFLITGCQIPNKTYPKVITAERLKSLSENDIFAISELACIEIDKRSVIPADDHALSQRINKIAKTLPTKANNIEINYKVYINTEPNAWSTANGCIRVNSGLIKLLNDNELQAVLAHEQAHIALKHAVSLFLQAPYIEFTDNIDELVIIAKEEVAQQYEVEADNYAFDLLVSKNIDPMSLVEMLVKVPIHSTNNPTSHPSSKKRIMNIINRINGK